MNLYESYLYSWGLYFRVSQSSLPRTTANQIWMSFLSVYVIVLTTCYSSNLTAFLTVERAGVSMETVRELYSSNLDVVTVGFFFKVSLEESGNVYLKGLATRYKGLSNYQESYSSLIKGEAVLLETKTYLEYLIATDFTLRGKQSMRILKECYAPYSIAIALQKNFPLKKRFDKVLGWLYDTGILRQWFLNLLRSTKVSKKATTDAGSENSELEAEDAGGSKSIALSIDHLQGIFYIHLAGLIISTFLFFSEMCLCNESCRSRRE
ncbi:glutamate receptor 2-like [Palaemon carinicauda]|uniref:glutamate receptor 2-like n=1 Tax=Palaemon carinicauda TaxID=392227 RepID=UPI0035B5AD4A